MNKWRFSALALLPLLLSVVTSCIIGEVNRKESDEDTSEEKISMTFLTPNLNTSVLVDYKQAEGQSTRYTSKWNDQGKVFMFAKQNGKMINLGQYPISSVNSDNTIFKVEVDASDKLDSKESYQLYGLSGAFNVDDNELFYRVNLVRNNGMNLWFTGQKGSTSKMSNVAGTAEMLFVINKSSKPIQFVHKGYDAEEKWYYTKAEVSVEDGHIQKAEQGSEVAGSVKEINVFDGKVLESVVSYYVPNSKKIQDAQLVAEIDGKEVRSVNRISSDVTLQTNHSYGIFAVWDGEKLTLGDGSDEPEVYVFSGEHNDSILVQEVRNDGTIVFTGSLKKIPKAGEIIVSGISPKAPQGFLYKVKDIKNTNGTYEVKTEDASIDELLQGFSGEIPIPLGNVASARMRSVEGVVSPVKINRASKDVDIINLSWKGMVCALPQYNGTPNFLLFKENDSKEFDFSRQSSIGLTYDISAKLSATFVLETNEEQNRRIGLKGNLELSATLGAIAALKEKYNFGKYKIGQIDLSPIEVVVPIMGIPIPIVFTPKIYLYVEITASGELYLSAKLLSYKAGGYFDYCYYVDGDPLTGDHNVFDADWSWGPIEDISDISKAGGDLIKGDNVKIGLKGEVKAKFDVEPNFGLYNSNDRACIAIEVAPFVSLKGNMAYTFNYNSTEEHFEGDFNDEFSLNVGVDGKVSGRIKLWDEPKELGKEFEIFSMPLWEPFGITMHFDDFNLRQEDDKIYVTCKITKPAFQALPEADYGFCYGIDANKKDQWTYVSLKSKYDKILNPLLQNTEMQYLLDSKNLKPQTKYFIRPYVRYYNTYIHKPGSSFETIVADNGIAIPIVPGYNL